jgi:lipoic acid synthetase
MNETRKPVKRLPPWLRRPIQTQKQYTQVDALLRDLNLNTVCSSAKCPNRHECWNCGTATFMILGAVCTRNCRFCNVEHGAPQPPDPDEPARLAQAAGELKLKHVVITSVTRDDLPDGGATHFSAVLRAVQSAVPGVSTEVLTPDFQGDEQAIGTVLDAGPQVYNHNLETVQRLQHRLRPQAAYEVSLKVLRCAADRAGGAVLTKSGLMLGLGETDSEIEQALEDLRAAGCELLTLGQYLAPSTAHVPVERFVPPSEFAAWEQRARAMGFRGVAAGPLVRSSYCAEKLIQDTGHAEV